VRTTLPWIGTHVQDSPKPASRVLVSLAPAPGASERTAASGIFQMTLRPRPSRGFHGDCIRCGALGKLNLESGQRRCGPWASNSTRGEAGRSEIVGDAERGAESLGYSSPTYCRCCTGNMMGVKLAGPAQRILTLFASLRGEAVDLSGLRIKLNNRRLGAKRRKLPPTGCNDEGYVASHSAAFTQV
jgi:hypothetical protein